MTLLLAKSDMRKIGPLQRETHGWQGFYKAFQLVTRISIGGRVSHIMCYATRRKVEPKQGQYAVNRTWARETELSLRAPQEGSGSQHLRVLRFLQAILHGMNVTDYSIDRQRPEHSCLTSLSI
jgi:hypothetical protein